jgi:hypothetical protein
LYLAANWRVPAFHFVDIIVPFASHCANTEMSCPSVPHLDFRIDEETKRLAQKAIERKGSTLSDACRNFTEQLADE